MGPGGSAREVFDALAERVDARLYGVRPALKLLLVGILTDSHVLVDDVPGVGKTTLIRMLASLLGLRFARVQFTPDLMPSDITGTSVLNQEDEERILTGGVGRRTIPQIAIGDALDLESLRRDAQGVRLEEPVRHYVVSLARATREHPDVQVGASPRAIEHMGDAVRAFALL